MAAAGQDILPAACRPEKRDDHMSIRIGCCLPGGKFRAGDTREMTVADVLADGYMYLKECGYDYAEVSAGLITPRSDEDFGKLLKYHSEGKFAPEVSNGFIPGSVSLYDPSRRAETRAYVEKTVERLHKVGVQIAVFGSGAARNLPNIDPQAERSMLCDFLKMCDEVVGQYGMVLAIEPLRSAECNVLNKVTEVGELCRELALPNVRMIADVFHMAMEGEDLHEALRANIDQIVHTHVCECPTRLAPCGEAGGVLKSFAASLAELGYSGRATLECIFKNYEADARAAAASLRSVFPV